MSKLTQWAKKNPDVAAFLRALAIAALSGHSGNVRNDLLSQANELDADGDGIPDAAEAAAPATTKPPRKPRG